MIVCPAVSILQAVSCGLVLLRRPHSAYMLNAKKLVVTFSRAVSSLAMLAGALRLWSLELPEIAGFVMLTNISTIVFTIAFQLGDISIVIANAVSGGVRAARDASLAMRGAVDAIGPARWRQRLDARE